MTLRSWDFYDTLVTRLVAHPEDVFRIMEEKLELPGFASRRVAAERKARRKFPKYEVTLKQIYDCLALEPISHASILDMELDLERSLAVPVPKNLELVQHEDILVSDTYMPPEELLAVLKRFTKTPPSTLWVSSREGVRKHEGLLWDRVLKKYQQGLSHTGDNRISDERQPGRRGVITHGFRHCDLLAGEQHLAQGGIDGAILAGCSRAARIAMALDEDDPRAAFCDTIASVYAPVLVAFAEWIFVRASELEVTDVTFMARDGQLLLYTAECLAPYRDNAPRKMHYIYGSRRALHLPGFASTEEAMDWILEDTPILRLRDLADRAGLDSDEITTIARTHGFEGIDRNIPTGDRPDLLNVVRDKRFIQALEKVSQTYWPSAFEYYHNLNFGKHPILMVDVGWSGKMQESLSRLIAKGTGSKPRIHGAYLSLSAVTGAGPSNTLQGFLHTPAPKSGLNPLDKYRGVIESVLQADHGTTIGFNQSPGVAPILDSPPDAESVELVLFQRKIIKAFVLALIEAEKALGRPIQFERELLLGNLMRKLSKPKRREAQAFLQRTHAEGQVERERVPVVSRVGSWTELMTRAGWGVWPEGTLSVNGLRGGIGFVNLIRHLKSLR